MRSLEEREEMLDLGVELFEIWVRRNSDAPATVVVCVVEMVRTRSLEELRALVQEWREERLPVKTLAKLPGYLVFDMLEQLERELGFRDWEQLRRMTYGIDPNG